MRHIEINKEWNDRQPFTKVLLDICPLMPIPYKKPLISVNTNQYFTEKSDNKRNEQE